MRNIVITGGTSGIGKACLEKFLKKNDNVIVLSRKNPDGLKNFFKCDVSNFEDVKGAFLEIKKQFKTISFCFILGVY